MGYQHIHKDSKNSKNWYLEYVHKNSDGTTRRCHLGRIRTTEEALAEFDDENSKTREELIRDLAGISRDIRNLIDSYSPNTSLRMHVMSRKLTKILEKHGC